MTSKKWLLIISLLISSLLPAQESKSKFSALAFADYYYVVQHHTAENEGSNGFWFRRIYLTYDHQINENFSARARLEMNHDGEFKTKSSLEPYVKDAYLKWEYRNHELYFGISPTPSFKLISEFWGYRAVEKTLANLQRYNSSRGLGVSVKGNLLPKLLNYHFMAVNGTRAKAEADEGKQFMLSLSTATSENYTFEIYGDWNDLPGKEDRFTLQAFLGFKIKSATFGAHFTRQLRQSETEEDITLDGVSAFVRSDLSKKFKFFLRGDIMLDPNPEGENIPYLPFAANAKSTFLLAGLEFIPAEGISVIPNVETIFYSSDDPEIDLNNDIIPRITLYYKF